MPMSEPTTSTNQDTGAPHRPDHLEKTIAPTDRDGSLERLPTAPDHPPQPQPVRTTTTTSSIGPIHSVFSKNEKRFIVVMASFAGFFSAVSSQIYFPALNDLARDLKVSNSLINLTLTSYMIFQGLAPAFIGELADISGRRPAYALCFTVYIGANIGLALQNDYAALFLLRCLQSSGSSGTIALSSGVVADVATAAERGSYMGFVTAGSLLGPAIGPIIGGVLAQFLGWRSIFWFLVILSGVFLLVFAVFFPETARSAVGNGSTPPQGWNMSLVNYLTLRKARKDPTPARADQPKTKKRFPNPLSSVIIILDPENALLLFYTAFLFAAFYDVTATIPSLYAEIYHYNALQIGLCYIPFGVGSCLAALMNGQFLDRSFRRWAKKVNMPIKKGRQQALRHFPIEKARLGIAFPATYSCAILMLIYGWVLQINGPLAAVLVLLFGMSFTMTIAFNVTSTLLIDFYPGSPATATAANNLCRCLMGAGSTAVVIPMINHMGRGWTFTFLSLFLIVSSPMLWAVYFRGMHWREERRVRDERKKARRDAEQGGHAGYSAEKSEREPDRGDVVRAAAVAEEERELQTSILDEKRTGG